LELEGEGVKFVSGVEGVWIAGKGDVDAAFEFGFRRFGSGGLPFGAEVPDDDGCSLLDLGEREAGLRCVTKRWTI
jgi:hypothetical protein